MMDMHHLPMHSVASHGQTRTAWTAQEDAILRARVAAIGAGAGLWPEVAKGLPGRTSKSCAERWQTHLNPAYVRSSEQEFSDWEVAVMILAYARHSSNWLKVSEYLPMRSPQNIKNQVNYFNAKPEHVRDNKYLSARIELEKLLEQEPEIVRQRREKLREVLIKGQSALPAGALQAAYAAAKLTPPNMGPGGSRMHPYARPTSLQASYGMQPMSAFQMPAMQPMQQPAMQPQQGAASPPAGLNAMMLLAQAACGDDTVADDPAAAAAAAAAPVPEGPVLAGEQEEEMQQASQHGVAGLQLPMIQTRPPQHSLLQQNGSGGSSSSSKQPGSASAAAQTCFYPPAMQGPGMSAMLMPGLMAMQGSPMASSEGLTMPAPAAAAALAKQGTGTASPASTPLAALGATAASAGLTPEEFAALAAVNAAALPRPSKSGSSLGTRRPSKAGGGKFGEFMNGDDMSTSEEAEGEETGDLTPLAQRVAEAAAAAVSAATQQAVTATQQACQVLSMAQMLAQQAQQQEAKPAASDRSSHPSGGEPGGEQQAMEAAVTQRLNNQHSNGTSALAAAAAAGVAAAGQHRLDDAVRHLLEAHYEKMQQLQQQLQQELQEQLATLGKLHTTA